MQIERIKITNVMGHELLEFKAGKFNEITGGNAEGKSSILTAIISGMQGADKKEATMLRKGSTTGETVIILDDNTEIKKIYTVEGSKIKVSNHSKPAEFLQKILDLVSFSPARFLLADPKEQLQLILESISIVFTREELIAQLDGDEKTLEYILDKAKLPKDQQNFDLNEYGSIRKAVYEERTEYNGAVRKGEATLNTLIETVPAEAIELDSIKEQLHIAEENLTTLQQHREKRLTEFENDKAHTLKVYNDEFTNKQRELQEKKEAEIQEIQLRYAKLNEELHEAKAQQEQATISTCDHTKNEFLSKYESHKTPLLEHINTLRAQIESSAAIQSQQQLLQKLSNEREEFKNKAALCDKQLVSLDTFKTEKTQHIPIAGLNIQNSEITVNGVQFKHVNTAERIRVALSLARLRAGELRVICIDGMEALSSEYYTAFKKAAEESELQFFVTRVTDGPLHIETE